MRNKLKQHRYSRDYRGCDENKNDHIKIQSLFRFGVIKKKVPRA